MPSLRIVPTWLLSSGRPATLYESKLSDPGALQARLQEDLPSPTPIPAAAAHPLVFDWQHYRSTYLDLADNETREQALWHWWHIGILEGRRAVPTFCPMEYLLMHADVRLAADQADRPVLQTALEHWLTTGHAQGRPGCIHHPLQPQAAAPEPPSSDLGSLSMQLRDALQDTAPAPSDAQQDQDYLNISLPAALMQRLSDPKE